MLQNNFKQHINSQYTCVYALLRQINLLKIEYIYDRKHIKKDPAYGGIFFYDTLFNFIYQLEVVIDLIFFVPSSEHCHLQFDIYNSCLNCNAL